MKFPYIESLNNPVARKLLQYVRDKKSNLAISAEVGTAEELLALSELVADHIVVLKTHIDTISGFTLEMTEKLRTIADNAGFLIFEDRKFADIGKIVMHQVRDGMYTISSWADIINAHLLPGSGIIDGLKEGCKSRDVGLLLVAQMSSKNNLFSQSYTSEIVKIAEDNQDFVIGFIAQEKLSDQNFITMTPGVNFSQKDDAFGQAYHTPRHVIEQNKSDIIIVGRGILNSSDPRKMADFYQKTAWNILEKRLK
jgi:uridine monophosphate synthetase